jgi:hypothetical protein
MFRLRSMTSRPAASATTKPEVHEELRRMTLGIEILEERIAPRCIVKLLDKATPL